MDTPSRNYPHDDQRVSDADRDHAVSELSEAFQTGRITADEFDQRSGRALSARTGKELTDLLTDLQKDNVPAARTGAYGIDWAGIVTPAIITVLLIALTVLLWRATRVRRA